MSMVGGDTPLRAIKLNSVSHETLLGDWQIREVWGFANPARAIRDLLKFKRRATLWTDLIQRRYAGSPSLVRG
jgi:hypothetical protein